MTYAVNGLRELTVGAVETRLWIAIAVLGGVLAVSLAASSWPPGATGNTPWNGCTRRSRCDQRFNT
jgi:hypothetical protein